MLTDSKITMLGTGNAGATRCYNTCFVLESGRDRLLVDAGGGNGILRQLNDAGIALKQIHHLFFTHTHTDHILGCVWVIRMAMQKLNSGKYDGPLHVYSHKKGIDALRQICQLTLPIKVTRHLDSMVVFHELQDREQFEIGAIRMQAFDIQSKKELQFGFRAELPDGKSLVCLGDEPYNPECADMLAGADWLMSESFCLYSERDIYKPYEKYHSTATDAARLAQETGIRNLIIYHTVDAELATRKERFTAEAKQYYDGNIVVPDDLEIIKL